MATARGLRVRRSFRDVERDHYTARKANPKARTELEVLVLAFKGIQELPPTDYNSFFIIAGYHGEPFRGAGWSNPSWWGGYCFHGCILFPTWHRGYCDRLEMALRSIPGCEDVTLPFLDWCDAETRVSGLPVTFGQKEFVLSSGSSIKNPLYSYTFQSGVFDDLSPIPDADYTKPAGYETVRFPYSGLVGSGGDPNQKAATDAYNKKFPYPENVGELNKNITDWLNKAIDAQGDQLIGVGTYDKFKKCLDAPNYTVFSNTSSAQQYNQENLNNESVAFYQKDVLAVPLESPHNDMHVAVGGFGLNPSSDGTIMHANGDMGENDTAAFDPIFFFHHCFVDRMFWLWQLKHHQATRLNIDPKYEFYAGTSDFDGQGPTPGRPGGEWLNLQTPLDPFKCRGDDGSSRALTSLDVIDIENQLGYTYGPGSFTDASGHPLPSSTLHEPDSADGRVSLPKSALTLPVAGINRGAIGGSFVIVVTGEVSGGKEVNGDGKDEVGESNGEKKQRRLLGYESVLSRWHTQGCANCQTHLAVKTFVPLHVLASHEDFAAANVQVALHTRAQPSSSPAAGAGTGTAPKSPPQRMVVQRPVLRRI